MAKITKSEAVYFPARYVDMQGYGTTCGKCRDFIKRTSECVIVDGPLVQARTGTCALYVHGKPHEHGVPLRLIPKAIAGYIEGPEVPTYCGRCVSYLNVASRASLCSRVGDTDSDTVEYGGCCALYHARP